MTSLAAPQSGLLRQYLVLTKPRVTQLAVFCAVIGMFLAVPGLPPLHESVFGLFGIWLAASSAAAINHLIDQRIDKVMVRTAHRPLATGALRPGQVLAFALVLGIASMLVPSRSGDSSRLRITVWIGADGCRIKCNAAPRIRSTLAKNNASSGRTTRTPGTVFAAG